MQIQKVGPTRELDGALLQGKAIGHEPGWATVRHSHDVAQLLYAISGVMRVVTPAGQWIVPPSRGIWVPAGIWHETYMLGKVEIRTVYVRPDAHPALPEHCCVLAVGPLLRELILTAITLDYPAPPDSRADRVARLILDEITTIETLPLVLPMPQDGELGRVCRALLAAPDDTRTADDWAAELGLDTRTLQRRFGRATGMSFGEWRRQARLLKALERLAAGKRVLDVALESGYASPSAFTAMFRRQFGVAPSVFFR